MPHNCWWHLGLCTRKKPGQISMIFQNQKILAWLIAIGLDFRFLWLIFFLVYCTFNNYKCIKNLALNKPFYLFFIQKQGWKQLFCVEVYYLDCLDCKCSKKAVILLAYLCQRECNIAVVIHLFSWSLSWLFDTAFYLLVHTTWKVFISISHFRWQFPLSFTTINLSTFLCLSIVPIFYRAQMSVPFL